MMRRVLFAILAVLAAPECRAHNLGESYVYLQIHRDTVRGRFEMQLADFNRALRLTGTDRAITANNLDQRIGFLKDYNRQHVTISDRRGRLDIRFTTHRHPRGLPPAAPAPGGDQPRADLGLRLREAHAADAIHRHGVRNAD